MNIELYQPYLPQMNDGVITEGDLSVDNTIDIEILPYSGLEYADFIELHFGGLPLLTALVQDINAEPTVLFRVSAEQVSDGIWPVWYEVTDVAGNTASSPVGWAVVERNDIGVLDAPVFTDVNETTHFIDDESVQHNQGTHVSISSQPEIGLNDRITLLFFITNKETGDLIVNSQYKTSLQVTEEEVTGGIVFLIPEPYVVVTREGICHARYLVSRETTGEVISSLTGEANLSLADLISLPAPVFTDARNGWLTPEQIQSGLHILASWSSPVQGDEITMYLSGFDMNGFPVDAASDSQAQQVSGQNETDGNVLFTFDQASAEAVGTGRLSAYYIVNDVNVSLAASVGVDMNSTGTLPAPVFTQATDDELHEVIINQAGIVLIDVHYDTMAEGDIVVLSVTGKDSAGLNVPEAIDSLFASLDADDINAGKHTFQLPLNNALSVGEQGHLYASYTVTLHDNGGIAFSLPTEVTLVNTLSSVLTLTLTTGAPIFDETLDIVPLNRGFLTGPAGMNVNISCSPPAVIRESGSQIYNTTIAQDGSATFSVYSPAVGAVDILVVDSQNSGNTISGLTAFNAWQFDPDASMLQAFGASSGSVADNTMPCSVYVITKPGTDEQPITEINVQVTEGEAVLIETGEQSGKFPLNPDNSVEIQLVSRSVGASEVRVSLPEASGNIHDFPIQFVSRP